MIILLSYIFFFIASTATSIQNRWIAKKKDFSSSEQIYFTFQVIFILFLGSLSFPFFSHFYIASNHTYLLLLALACGVFGAGTNLLYFISQKHVEAGVTTLVSNIYTPIAIVLASIFLHESLNSLQILGTVLLFIAVAVVSKKHHVGKFTFDKHFLLMLLSGVFLGVLIVAERALQKTTGFSAGIMMSWGSQALVLGLVAWFTKSKRSYTNTEIWTTGVLKFFSATSWVTLVYIVGNLSLVSSIATFKVIVVFIAGAFLLNEKEDLGRKFFGSIIAVMGLLLMK